MPVPPSRPVRRLWSDVAGGARYGNLVRAADGAILSSMSDERRDISDDAGVVTQTRTRSKLKKPKLYKVLLHNDDYTTMEFVVFVLMSIFHRSETDAVQIMLHVHKNGIGVAGVYTYEVA